MINYFTSSVEPKNLKNDLKSHAHQLLRIHDAAENISFTKKIRVLLKKNYINTLLIHCLFLIITKIMN